MSNIAITALAAAAAGAIGYHCGQKAGGDVDSQPKPDSGSPTQPGIDWMTTIDFRPIGGGESIYNQGIIIATHQLEHDSPLLSIRWYLKPVGADTYMIAEHGSNRYVSKAPVSGGALATLEALLRDSATTGVSQAATVGLRFSTAEHHALILGANQRGTQAVEAICVCLIPYEGGELEGAVGPLVSYSTSI